VIVTATGGAAAFPLQPVTYTPTFVTERPRAVVLINGERYIPSAFAIKANAHGASNSATITLPVSNNPDFSQALQRGEITNDAGAVIATDNSPLYAEIRAGYPENPVVGSTQIEQLSRRFLGVVDLYSVRFGQDQITFQCRSLAGQLLDDKLTSMHQNKRTTQFLQEQCDRCGLRLVTNLANHPWTLQEVLAFDNVGGSNFTATVYGMSVWNLMLRCAQADDVDIWIDGDTLHYEAAQKIRRNNVDLRWGRDFSTDGLEGAHAIQFNRYIRVSVHTHQPTTLISHSSRYESDGFGGVNVTTSTRHVTGDVIPGTNEVISTSYGADGTVTVGSSVRTGGNFNGNAGRVAGDNARIERYVFFAHNLPPDKANALAKAKWRQFSQHEFKLTGKLPMTSKRVQDLSITSLARISGCQYAKFNSTYWPRAYVEHFDRSGWRLEDLILLNHVLPQGEV
jgi:hypothetical protein